MESKNKLKILITQPIHQSGEKLLIDKGYDVRVASDITESTLAQEIWDVSGLLVRTAEIPASVIEAGRALRVIARHGVGYDNIDVAAATRRKIPVCITTGANAVSVAEHVLALMLALTKKIVPYDRATRKNNWDIRNNFSAVDLEGKILGVIGMGRTGTLVCRKAKAAFNMEVLVYSPRASREIIEKAGGKKVSGIPELLKVSDIVTLHVPLTGETSGLIGKAELHMMKPSAFLINCARGPLVDEEELFRALKDGIIAGAGLDVFDPEPPKADNPLFGLTNVVLSPHSAALTAECVMRMASQAAQAIIDVLDGRRPEGVINPEVFQ
jgi:D-3-phosphoglycerate dehydrogenase / 2-oxoglutarate reductase